MLVSRLQNRAGNFVQVLSHLVSLAGPYSGVAPPEIGAFPSLQNLYLTGLNFSGIPTAVGGLQQLQTLAIDNNVITTLPNELATIKNLTSLTLGGNQFSILPTVVPLLTSLIRLDLSYNYWAQPFPDTMGNLKNLQAFIAMSSNLQTAFGGPYFPAWMLNLKNLGEIILDFNPTFGATLNATLGTLPLLGYLSCVQCGLKGKDTNSTRHYLHFRYFGWQWLDAVNYGKSDFRP